MSRFACGKCRQAYDRKYAPRYVSACETEYPVSHSKTCAQCGELPTSMTICLACAFEHNQCQECRSSMYGVREDLLSQVLDFRARFNQSIAKHHAAFADAISGFKEEVELFLSQCQDAEKRMEADVVGLDQDADLARYELYLVEIRDLPFPHRAQYEFAKVDLNTKLNADRDLFSALVEQADQLLTLRRSFVDKVTRAGHSWIPSYTSDEPPAPIDTELVAFARSQLTEAELLAAETERQRSFLSGKRMFERLSGCRVGQSGVLAGVENEKK